VVSNQNIATIAGLRIRCVNYINYWDAVKNNTSYEGFASGNGRKFPSWIDASGWSNSKNAGDLIDTPNFIIASLLIDELGLAHTDLDKASFDAADNTTTITARLNQINQESAWDIIQKLCEQSTFAFFFSGAGKAKLIPLDNTSPTISRTIPFSHLVANSWQVSKTPIVANYINAKSRWQEEYGAYRDIDIATHGGTDNVFDAEWKNIAGTSVDNLLAHLITNSNAIWSHEHNQLEISTLGLGYADLEIGDWIMLDGTTVDPHFKAYGQSWDVPQLLIVEIQQTYNSTYIRAIEIYHYN